MKKNILSVILIILPFVLVVVFGVWVIYWQYERAETMLERWAKQNNYRIVSKEVANPGDGPMAVRASNRQIIYRVELLDENQKTLRATVICGSQTFGVLEDELEVDWRE